MTFTAIPTVPRGADTDLVTAYAASLIGRRALVSYGSRIPLSAKDICVIVEATYNPVWRHYWISTDTAHGNSSANVYVEDRPVWPWPSDQESPWAHPAPSITL